MRQYQPIWEELKKAHTATIHSPISHHQRIIQAVRKEKTKDDGWKLLCSEDNTRYILNHTTAGQLIKFTLTKDSHYDLKSGL